MPFLDLAIVFYLVIEKNKQGVNSVCITNELMKRWQVGIRQLYKQARENTKKNFSFETPEYDGSDPKGYVTREYRRTWARIGFFHVGTDQRTGDIWGNGHAV